MVIVPNSNCVGDNFDERQCGMDPCPGNISDTIMTESHDIKNPVYFGVL